MPDDENISKKKLFLEIFLYNGLGDLTFYSDFHIFMKCFFFYYTAPQENACDINNRMGSYRIVRDYASSQDL